MKNTTSLLILVFLTAVSSCTLKEKDPNATIEIIEHYSEIEEIINAKDHEITVLNFWSTACPPCIRELPHFNQLATEYKDKQVKVLLISLEDPKRLKTYIYPFVKKQGIVPEVVVLNDQNYNVWTDKVSSTWFGALPATLILKGQDRKFKFGSYATYEELRSDLEGLIDR
ncbi:MAG: TlpA disulfide reductase family protein [Maribacter sp.]|uniref:TlpA disulfide reductase family protein n=1 Tax=Maribacter sp. TaxID=1897614 RepID=UPI003C713A8A